MQTNLANMRDWVKMEGREFLLATLRESLAVYETKFSECMSEIDILSPQKTGVYSDQCGDVEHEQIDSLAENVADLLFQAEELKFFVDETRKRISEVESFSEN